MDGQDRKASEAEVPAGQRDFYVEKEAAAMAIGGGASYQTSPGFNVSDRLTYISLQEAIRRRASELQRETTDKAIRLHKQERLVILAEKNKEVLELIDLMRQLGYI